MEERNKNGTDDANEDIATETAADDFGGNGTVPVYNKRRTAAIDVLTRALLSPPILGETEANTEKTPSTGATPANAVAEVAAAARSFLETTSSVYVLNADTSSTANPATTIVPNTNASPTTSSEALGGQNNDRNDSNAMPKIFGCWNFLHQAMNEIERFEDEQNHLANSNTNTRKGLPLSLLPETRLLAEFAVKVARRSDEFDEQKVATCVENFCASGRTASAPDGKENAGEDPSGNSKIYNNNSSNEATETNDSESDQTPKGRLDAAANQQADPHRDIRILLPHLVHANAEIREIVTGRIAAFSFSGGQYSPRSSFSTSNPSATAFGDPLVVETFCRFLAANAVSNGAERLQRFLNDWIIPGATVDETAPSNGLHHLTNAITATIANAEGGTKRQRLSPEGSNQRRLQHKLPPYSLACVLYHVAVEAETTLLSESNSFSSGTISPLGTIDVLQRLSLPVMANVLLRPVLHDTLQRQQLKRQRKQHKQHSQQQQQHQEPTSPTNETDEEDVDDMDDVIIATGLRAIRKWCNATGLSLAQAKHIGSKVQVNLSRLLGESLQTDSPRVMSAMADLIEDVVEQHVVPQPNQQRLISESRMVQTRYLMQVPDEASFRANVSEEQLHVIETKELSDMLAELSVDVEAQRFRFPSFGKQAAQGKRSSPKKPLHGEVLLDNDMHSLGHSLARIAAALCRGFSKVAVGDAVAASATQGFADAPRYRIPGPGVLELLSKCASHPSVAICGIVLPVITPVLKTEVGLATQWLPTLQRRAIIPHHPNNAAILSLSSPPNNSQTKKNSDETYIPLLAASDVCFVEFEEFVDCFRETVLSEALEACYRIHSEYYLASCTAAIEEFCVGEVATEQTSFHLEAALFCLAVVSEQVLSGVLLDSSSGGATNPVPGSKPNPNVSSYLLRCTVALAKKPKSLNNPLTMAQACRFIRKYAKWYGSNQNRSILDIAADLTLFVLVQCATNLPDAPLSRTVQKETGVTPYSEAAKTLRSLLCNNAKYFVSNKAIAALGAGWEATFVACNRGGKLLTLEDRKETCIGICHVLAALPKDQQQTSLMALALASIACLEAMVKRADSIESNGENGTISPMLDRAADEITVLVTTARAFTEATSPGIESGRYSFAEPSMMVLRRAWPTISIVASKYSFHDSILESLRYLFVECLPMDYKSDVSLAFLQDLCVLAQKVIQNNTTREKNNCFFSPVLHFVDGFVEIHGGTFESIILSKQSGGEEPPSNKRPTEQDSKVFQCLDSLAQETIEAMTSQNVLGSAWVSVQSTQGNGQSASESKSKPPLQYNRADFCSSGLAPLFTFLRTCTVHCPAFLLHVLASGDQDCIGGSSGGDDYGDDDAIDAFGLQVMRKALESAVSSIIDVEAEISIRAIALLESVASLAANSTTSNINNNSAIRRLTGEYNLKFQTSMLSMVLRGTCGILQPSVLPDACRLLFHTLSKLSLSEEELKVIVLRGLSQEHFFLGNRARSVVYEFCISLLRISHNSNDDAAALVAGFTQEKLENMMTDVWRLHRFENVDTIEPSDAVHAFCVRHGRKNLPTTAS